MSVDINKDLEEASQKTKVYKKYKQYKTDYEKLKKKSGNSEEIAQAKIANQLNKFVDWRKRHTAGPKTFLEELIKQLKSLKGSGLETDKLIKRIFINTLKKIKPEVKNLLISEIQKSLNCTTDTSYTFPSFVYLPVKCVDLFGIFEFPPDDKIGKLFYEKNPIAYNQFPFSMNRELYERTQNLNQTFSSVAGFPYNGKSGEPLFDISYVENYIDPLLGPQQGSFFKVELKQRSVFPTVDQFLNDYYETIDLFDYTTFFTNLVDYVTGSISFGRGDGNLKLENIQKTLIIMQRILGLCSDTNKEIEVGGTSKVSEVDNIDQSFYEFNDIDLRYIDQITSDIKLGVVEFEECDNLKYPLNLDAVLTALDNLNFNEDTSDVNEIDAASGIIYPALDENFKLSLDAGFFENFIKALITTVLSPKTILPLMTMVASLGQLWYKYVSNIEDFLKIFKTFFNEFMTKVSAIFTKAVFNELKKEIKSLVLLLTRDLEVEKKKKLNLIILSIIAVVPALIKIVKDFRECKSVLDELLQLLNLGVQKKIKSLEKSGGEIPLPLLLSSRLLDGYSPTRSFLNVVQNLEELGIPTGPMPDGSPNEFILSIKAIIDGNSQEIAENGKVGIGIGPLTVTPAGITLPNDAYGKFI